MREGHGGASASASIGPGLPHAAAKMLLFVFVAAFLMRAGWGAARCWRHDGQAVLEFPDEQQYWLMGTSLHAGDGLRDEFGFRATRMPLYPGALSLFCGWDKGILGVQASQWLIGAIGAVLAAVVGMTLFDRRVGLIAGLLVSVDPFFVFFSSLLLTETLAITVTLALWVVAKPIVVGPRERLSYGRYAAVGVLVALSVYVRESTAGLAILLLLWGLARHKLDRRSLVGSGLAVAIVVVALLPWAVRNRQVTGSWCWLTYRGGISLYDGVGPQADGSSDLGDIQQMPAVEGLDEVAWNRFFLDRSFEAMRSDPARLVGLAFVKMKRTWNPWPNVDAYQSAFVRFVSVAWTLPVFALSLAGCWAIVRRREPGSLGVLLFLVLPALYLSVVHSFFVGSVRYRLVAMPMIEILASVALIGLYDRLCRTGHAQDNRDA